MKFEWKTPHDFYPRLAQALLTAGAAGLLYISTYHSTALYAPAAQAMAEETEALPEAVTKSGSPETETEGSSKPSKKKTTETAAEEFSKPHGAAQTAGKTKTKDASAGTSETKDASDGTSGTEDASAETSETKGASDGTSEVEDASAESSEMEDASEEGNRSDGMLETEIADSKEGSKGSLAVEYAGSGAPLADSKSILYVLQDEIAGLVQFQPNYLDLTKASLSWTHLEEEITSMTESYSGNWSVYVKDLSTGDVINVNQTPMESASLIKLFIMGAVMEQIHDGTLEETETIDRLLNEMITVSDNEAANELVRYLSDEHDHKDGLTYLNDFAARHGFSDTRQVNGLEDPGLRHDPSDINKTSARDCGELLAEIYDGTLVSHLSSRKMEDLLLDQEITYKIPSALPDEALSANKTGEISDAENDSAIIYSPGGDFILCIMSGKWDSGNQAITHIREITKLVYNHFNPPKVEVVISSEE